jgi:Glycosyl hydrolase family 76
MYNHTNGAQKWKDRIQGYLDNTQRVFFAPQFANGKVMTEYACEPQGNCNVDQRSFKAYLARWLAVCAQLAPFSRGQILPWIQDSAVAASKACTLAGGDSVQCGRIWYEYRDDGSRDIGHQMTAMSVIQSNLVLGSKSLEDIHSGNSKSDPSAGGGASQAPRDPIFTRKMTAADKAGAWILTLLMLGMFIAGAVLMGIDGDEYTGFVGGNGVGGAPGKARAGS